MENKFSTRYMLFLLLDYNQHNVSVKQWSSGCLSNSKSQSVSGTSDQLSEGRKKRHLSETAVGKRKMVLFKMALLLQKYVLYKLVYHWVLRMNFKLSPKRILYGTSQE